MLSIQCPASMANSIIIPSYDVSLVRWRFTSTTYILFLLHLRHCRYISIQICLWRYSAFSPRAPAAALDTGVFLTYFWTQKSAVRSSYLLKVHGALGSKHSCDLWRFLTQKKWKESEWSMKKHVDLEASRTYIHFWIKVLLRCQCRWQVLVSSLYTECSNGDGVSFSRLALMELWVPYLYTGWRCSHHACGVIQGTFSSKSPSICSIKGLHLHWCKCCMFHFAPKQKMGILHCPQFLPSHCSSTTSLLGVRSFVFSGGLDLGSGRQNHMVKCLVNLANFKAQL